MQFVQPDFGPLVVVIRRMKLRRIRCSARPVLTAVGGVIAGACLSVTTLGCGAGTAPTEKPVAVPTRSVESQAQQPAAEPQKLSPELPGLHNVFWVAEGIYSGSEPEGDAGFASLAKLGVKTVVSVDGAVPRVEAAHAHELYYVHLPIGYDRVPAETGLALARVAREATGPIYVHCHHGKHRGPAAAAVTCIAAGKMTSRDALKILEAAGTGREYAGLWRDVEAYAAPAAGEPLPDLVEIAQVDSLTAAMAQVDRLFDELKLCRDAGWKSPPGHADLSPAQAALLVREALHEALRTTPADRYDDSFREWLAAAEVLSQQIETDVGASNLEGASAQLKALEASCKQCHAKYRN